MFLQRFLTTVILVPLVLLLIFYGNPWLLAAIVLLVFLFAVRECFQLIPLQKSWMCLAFLGFMLLSLWICRMFFSYYLALGLIIWGLNGLAIVSFPASQKYWGYPYIVAVVCCFVLPLFIQSLFQLYDLPQGKSLLVYLLFLIWAADIGAYISGKFAGKHKLIPRVSPGKSWEGVLGGFILSMLIAGIGYWYFNPVAAVNWFVLALGTVLIAIFGDLFVSMLKRRCQIKDTGTIIPGHGGILDRLDSLIAAMPVFYFGLTWSVLA